MDAREFEWESQLRFYWARVPDDLRVHQCTGRFDYGYEYMGLNGRLVITPLTDRIYLTLTQVPNVTVLKPNEPGVLVKFPWCTGHHCHSSFGLATLLVAHRSVAGSSSL